MRRIKFFSVFIFVVFSAAAQIVLANSVPSSSVVGKYGFDWLRPTKAKCAAITEQAAGGFKTCTQADANSPGSFTGKKDFYTCRVSKTSEYMIYNSQSRCREELEVMKSNGD